jgi:hypothetical protein
VVVDPPGLTAILLKRQCPIGTAGKTFQLPRRSHLVALQSIDVPSTAVEVERLS